MTEWLSWGRGLDMMGSEILEQIQKLAYGTVIFYKDSCDLYNVGLVVPRGLHGKLQSALSGTFFNALNQVYSSNVMTKIRKEGKDYSGDWDRRISSVDRIRYYELGSLDSKALIEVTEPVPEDGSLAKKFAEALEKELS